MPIYEYECPKCGRFDVIQKVSDKPLKANPDCNEGNCPKKAQRVMSAPAFHLKGTGWYKTDYSGSSPGGAAGKSGTSTEAAPAKSETSTDSGSSASGSDSGSSDTGKGGKKPKKACGSGCGCH